MTAKEYLEQIGKLDALIKNKLIEVERWRDIALSITTQTGGERVQSSGDQQKMASAVAKYVDIEKELTAAIDRFVDLRSEIISVIEQLQQEEYELLHLVYVQNFTLTEAADKMNYSYSWVTWMHGKALLNVQKIIDKRKNIV